MMVYCVGFSWKNTQPAIPRSAGKWDCFSTLSTFSSSAATVGKYSSFFCWSQRMMEAPSTFSNSLVLWVMDSSSASIPVAEFRALEISYSAFNWAVLLSSCRFVENSSR